MADVAGQLERLEPRVLLSAAAWFGGAGKAAAAVERVVTWRGRTQAVARGRWIITLTPRAAQRFGGAARAAERILARWPGARSVQGLGSRGTLLLQVAEATPRRRVLQWSRRMPFIAAVEPDRIVGLAAFAADPGLARQWSLHNTGQDGGAPDADIDAPQAWDLATGNRNVVIGVVDTGIDLTHPDLRANLWTNPGEIPGNNADDDNNGLVDDVHGYDFVNRDPDPSDDNGHGTHVAGTIGAVANNDIGVTGVAWDVALMALKVFDAQGRGAVADATAALRYVELMRQRGVNVRATNNSWGAPVANSNLLGAVAALGAADVLVVAAAGNDASNNDFFGGTYPASAPGNHVVSVTSTDQRDALSSFSNIGVGDVDLAAPGDDILSTLPGGTYGFASGTSMATPHVTGVAALLFARDPTLTAPQARAAILGGVDELPSLAGRVATGGRLNARGALDAAAAIRQQPPPPPDGDDPANPTALGVLGRTPLARSGSVGGADGQDLYQFTLTRPRPLRIVLKRLTADADLALLRGNRVVARSAQRGSVAERVELDAPPGNYTIRVTTRTAAVVAYRLRAAGAA